MDDEKTAVAVLEDEVSLGETWLFWLGKRASSWAEPENECFGTLASVLHWIRQQKAKKRRWLLITDIDGVGCRIPKGLKALQKELKEDDPELAGYAGVVLVEYLKRETLLDHVLVITGVDYGPLHRWLEKTEVRHRLKPLRAREVQDELREMDAALRGRLE